MDGVKNEMTYNGNHLFHYTTFESAMKILLTGFLRFGEFKNMNDIAEVKRDYLADIPDKTINRVFSHYRSLSFTKDSGPMDRGFSIDTLWGNYADKGNGACLVFNKEKLFKLYRKRFAVEDAPENLEVQYINDFTNLIAFEAKTARQIEKEIDSRIRDIFYTKDPCWNSEKEIRMITKKKKDLPIRDAIIGVILCLPKSLNIEKTDQYRILEQIKLICPFQIYHYSMSLGERTLSTSKERKWPLIGVEYHLDDSFV